MMHRNIDIAATELAQILSQVDGKPYITQEVIFGEGEPITTNEYVGNGASMLLLSWHNY